MPAQPSSLKHIQSEIANKLRQAKIAEHQQESFILLEYYCNKTKLDCLVNDTTTIAPLQLNKLAQAVARRIKGEPLYRIIGHRDFYGLMLNLNKDTLEPRFDTECVVELACKHIEQKYLTQSAIYFFDMGIGSGAISLAILHSFPNKAISGLGSDISYNCLKATKQNRDLHGLTDRLQLQQSNCFSRIKGKFDLIISNPPYIASAEIAKLDRAVKEHDPLRALDGGKDGLKFYKLLAQQSHSYLNDAGIIIVEIGSSQKQAVVALFHNYGYCLIDSRKDYSGLDRGLVFKRTFD